MNESHTKLTVLGQSLQNLYTQYTNDAFLVNRRYQRKLVWTVEEKSKLIDSIRGNLPIPLVLLAEIASGRDRKLEIIDGLQRLNAIVAFIENEFPCKFTDGSSGYFNLETLADTKLLRDENRLEQREPVLDRELCLSIVNYQLPVSTYSSDEEESVDEVFRRINSSGRKLSMQEIRQAGITSGFATLVRTLSADIRGDSSYGDVMPLREMPLISINNRQLDYGISSDEVYWVKNLILERESVRESKDEELVLDILLDIMLDPMSASGSEIRNDAYGRGTTELPLKVDSAIKRLGVDNVRQRFLATLDVLKLVSDKTGKPLRNHIIGNKNLRGIPRYFQALFVPIYQLLTEGFELDDVSGLVNTLDGFWDADLKISEGGGTWSATRKQKLFVSVRSILEPYFRQDDSILGQRIRQVTSEFESRLQMALTESAMFELKQGFTRLDENPSFDNNAFNEVLKTASAMANKSPSASGYIFFGVADADNDLRRIRDIYSVGHKKFGNYRITGTEHELTHLGMSHDDMMKFLVGKINSSKLEPTFASRLAESLSVFVYQGYTIWSLNPCSVGKSPVSWDNKYYIRKGNSTEELVGAQIIELANRFQN